MIYLTCILSSDVRASFCGGFLCCCIAMALVEMSDASEF